MRKIDLSRFFRFDKHLLLFTLVSTLYVVTACGQDPIASNVIAPTTMVAGDWRPMSSNFVNALGHLAIKGKTISWGKCKSVPFVVVSDIRREDEFISYGSAEKKIQSYRDIILRLDKSAICDQPFNLLSDPPKVVIRFLILESDPCYADILIYRTLSSQKAKKVNSRGTSYNTGGACKKP